MRSRLYDEQLQSVSDAVIKMFKQLKFEFWKQETKDGYAILFFAMKENKKVYLNLKMARKGVVKCTVEVEMQINNISDYELRKKTEVSLLNSLEAFVEYEENEIPGV